MAKHQCRRRECNRIRSEFSLFLNRKRPPMYEGSTFCSDSCLKAHFESVLNDKWRRLQLDKTRTIPRPKLGTILMQTAFLTREQVDQAIRLQSEKREGRIGEWLLRLGFVEEHQVSAALARQFGLPLINLKNSNANPDALRMIPGKVARSSGIIPVGFDDSQSALQIAVSAPVDFGAQEALRRMLGRAIVAYLGDQSVIERLLTQWYEPEERDLSDVPVFGSIEELFKVGNEMISIAIEGRALDVYAELIQDFFWIRLDFASESHHHFFRYLSPAAHACGPAHTGEMVVRFAAGT